MSYLVENSSSKVINMWDYDFDYDNLKVQDFEFKEGYFEAVRDKVWARTRGYGGVEAERRVLSKAKFVIVNFNDYDVEDYQVSCGVPAEVGAIMMSLRKGVMKQYAKLIDPRKFLVIMKIHDERISSLCLSVDQ